MKNYLRMLAPALLALLMAGTFAASQSCDSGDDNGDPCDGINCNLMCDHGSRRCIVDRVEECSAPQCCGRWDIVEDCADQGLTCLEGACVDAATP